MQKWIDDGRYQQQLDEGYIFSPYCGRFRTEPCTCSACRSKRIDKDELLKILTLKSK